MFLCCRLLRAVVTFVVPCVRVCFVKKVDFLRRSGGVWIPEIEYVLYHDDFKCLDREL